MTNGHLMRLFFFIFKVVKLNSTQILFTRKNDYDMRNSKNWSLYVGLDEIFTQFC